ncbi:hypothetical protein COLO4_31112 [Corchorus olitorius]|uniref:Uncharacterized protein n=1 Tax=Corchorus olitorius TaxID=93759 RepID=A0A1R3H5G8_9ROSI|nr:hypothetical protein COLO4_31112 [Corchorus olitorius]
MPEVLHHHAYYYAEIWSSTIVPHLRMPGLIAPNSYGAGFGYHPGGWGKSPVDEGSSYAPHGENENLQRAIRGRQIPKQGLHTLSMDGGSMKGLAIVQILRMTYIENDGKSNVSVCSQRWGKWILTVRVLSFSDTWVLFLFNFSYHGRVFYDAFFKYPTKPKLTTHGYLYHEGKQFEALVSEKEIFAEQRLSQPFLNSWCLISNQFLDLFCRESMGYIEKETKATRVYVAEDGRNGFCLSGLRFILHAIDLPEYFFYCRKEKVVGVILILASAD